MNKYYSPECIAMYEQLGNKEPIEVWVESVGHHLFTSDRDIYEAIPLTLKVAGNASSATGSVRIPVASTDPAWYKELTDAVKTMINADGKVEVRDMLGNPIDHLDSHQLANVGELDVYVDGKRFRGDPKTTYKLPMVMSPNKIEHLCDWYDTHRDALCAHVASTMENWNREEVKTHVQDGGQLERAICAFIEKEAHGPRGENWPTLIATYGIDQKARGADAHRTAQVIAKSLVSDMCTMLNASKDQVLRFYASKQLEETKKKNKSLEKGLWEEDTSIAEPLREGYTTDQWSSTKEMYHDLAVDAFDQPSVRDRVVVVVHRQPHAVAPVSERVLSKKLMSAHGNPLQEHEQEYFFPYYSRYPIASKMETKAQPYYGDYHKTMDMYHLYTGRHTHISATIGSKDAPEKKAPLEPIPIPSITLEKAESMMRAARTQKDRAYYTQMARKIKGECQHKLVPISPINKKMPKLVPLTKVGCGVKKDDYYHSEDEDEDDMYGMRHRKAVQSRMPKLVPINKEMPKLVPLTKVGCGVKKDDYYHADSGSEEDEEKEKEDDDMYGMRHRKAVQSRMPKLVPIKGECQHKLVPINKEMPKLVPLTKVGCGVKKDDYYHADSGSEEDDDKEDDDMYGMRHTKAVQSRMPKLVPLTKVGCGMKNPKKKVSQPVQAPSVELDEEDGLPMF